jgi:hypothetical protein
MGDLLEDFWFKEREVAVGNEILNLFGRFYLAKSF